MADRRAEYRAARKRLIEVRLPCDDAAEFGAVGAVILAPWEHSRRLVKRAYHGHFHSQELGWLWEELGRAIVKGRARLDTSSGLENWLVKSHVCWRFRDRFHFRLTGFMRRVLEPGFWWHGDWYIDRVIEAAKLRANVQRTAELYSEAAKAAEEWR